MEDLALARGVAIQVETDLQPVPAIAGSKAELREALTNLVCNVVDTMPEGGTITLRTHADGSKVVLEVNDTGTSMTEEERQRCLSPFSSTKGESGTGMGLAMVYGNIGRHNGAIGIQSTVGVGTTITIRLPVHMQASSDKDDVRNSPHIGSIYFIEGRPLKEISLDRLRV